MINELQQLKGKTKLKFFKNKGNYYDNMNIRFDEDAFARNAQGISKTYHKVLKLMKFLQTKPQVKNMNINFYDLFYTVIKTRDGNDNIDNEFENDDNDYINFSNIVPIHYIGIKKNNEIIK